MCFAFLQLSKISRKNAKILGISGVQWQDNGGISQKNLVMKFVFLGKIVLDRFILVRQNVQPKIMRCATTNSP